MVSFSQSGIDLSVIIVSYNVKDLLKKCLESIFSFQKDLSFEVVVIDNDSEDQSTKMLRDEFPQVKLMENRRNLGFSGACNQGIRRSRGRYVLLLNPDPRMMDPQGRVLFSCRSFPSYLTAISSGQSLLNRLLPHNPLSRRYLLKDLNRSEKKEVDWVSGSCLLTRRELFERIGLLDELFFMYVEDVDFCYRARQMGFGVYYFPSVAVIHHIVGACIIFTESITTPTFS
jgi:GT2 family glycosyltransferase